MVVLFILAFVGITLFEVPSLIGQKYWWELIVFFAFLSFAFLIGLLQILQVHIPNPVELITTIVEYFLDLVPI